MRKLVDSYRRTFWKAFTVEISLVIFLSQVDASFSKATTECSVHGYQKYTSFRKKFLSALDKRTNDSYLSNASISDAYFVISGADNIAKMKMYRNFIPHYSSKNNEPKQTTRTIFQNTLNSYKKLSNFDIHRLREILHLKQINKSHQLIHRQNKLEYVKHPSTNQLQKNGSKHLNPVSQQLQIISMINLISAHRKRFKRDESNIFRSGIPLGPLIWTPNWHKEDSSPKTRADSTDNSTTGYNPSGVTHHSNTRKSTNELSTENILLLSSLLPIVCAIVLAVLVRYIKKRKNDPERQKLVVRVVTGVYYNQTGFCF